MQKQKFARIQSPSSINTYNQCPRKYFYQYIARLKTLPSIHLVRGKIAHSVLEDFFKIDIDNISAEEYGFEFRVVLHELLNRHWNKSGKQLSSLGLSNKELGFYLQETKDMLNLWLQDFSKKLKQQMLSSSLADAFRALTPLTEQHFISDVHGVQGYIDAIFKIDNEIRIIDYKTSKHDNLSDSYRLQLAIYALLYNEKHGRMPDKVGIHFLKFSEKYLDVDKAMLEHATKECERIHKNTASNDIDDYPKKTSPLCRWSTGQCDFFDNCNSK